MKTAQRFANDPSSIGLARAFVTESLSQGGADAPSDVVLMASELATNAVVHAHSGFDLSVESAGEEVRVEVQDRGTGELVMRRPDPTAPAGRGLQIVATLSHEWGSWTTDVGRTVWFSVRR